MASLTFDEAPDYEKCRKILRQGLIDRGYKDDGKLVFMSATPKPASRKPKSKLNKVSKRGSPQSDDLDQSVDIFEEEEVASPPLKRLASPPLKRLATKKRALESPKLAAKRRKPSSAVRGARKFVPATVEESDDSEDSLPSEEKENKARKANASPRLRSPRVRRAAKRLSKSPLDKKANTAAVVKKVVQLATPEELAKAAGIVNPTPAMLEMFAKRSAKALKKK